MELQLAMKLEELSVMELEKLLEKFRREDRDAYELLKELIEDM